ncbi:cytochrome P450 9e2-like [Trichogramma pretiosum]|uniref:cytochrome P450 9e2-like n=1 Tax=Trichogramma pretiosum TaxID=7493 RepID=UPI0006C9DF4E|nr:cytochrome P450 9e2-like [Trichogramma pretiosum]
MDLIAWLLAGVVLYAIYLCLYERLRYFENLNLPYVPGVPFFGSMASAVFHINHISETINYIYKYNSKAKYIGAFNFMRPVIVVRDLDIITESGFLSRGVPDTGGDLFEGPRALYCKSWTSKELKEKFKLILEYGRNFVNYLSDLPEEARKTIDTKNMFEMLTNDILGICVYDDIIEDSFENPKNKSLVFGQKVTTSGDDKTMKLFIIRSFPNLMKWFNILRLFSNRVKRFFNCIVNTMIATQDEKGASRPDIISLMKVAQIKKGKNLKFQEVPEIVTYSLSRGSFDATSTQMCIIVHELAINPDIQKRLQEEIDDVLKRNKGEITFEALERMLYLDAIFKESIRLHPQFPFNGRSCNKAFELPPALEGSEPFVVQPGMSLWIPAVSINRDPKYNNDADKFIPDRYYQKEVTVNDVSSLGLGINPRLYSNNRFAIMQTKLMLFFLLSKFNLVPNEKTCSPLSYSKESFSLIPPGGFSLAIEPRSDASVYTYSLLSIP